MQALNVILTPSQRNSALKLRIEKQKDKGGNLRYTFSYVNLMNVFVFVFAVDHVLYIFVALCLCYLLL